MPSSPRNSPLNGGRTIERWTITISAIALAKEHGFTQVEALASELCGKFHLGGGRLKVASVYISEASLRLPALGGHGQGEELTEQFAELLAPSARRRPPRVVAAVPALSATLAPAPLGATTTAGAGRLDLASTIRAMQAIASELVLSTLIERLMRLLAENAGAQKGILVLEHDGRLVVEASFTVDADTVRLGLAQEVEASLDLSIAIVQYVARTQQAVVLGDAARESRFAGDRVRRPEPPQVRCCARPCCTRGEWPACSTWRTTRPPTPSIRRAPSCCRSSRRRPRPRWRTPGCTARCAPPRSSSSPPTRPSRLRWRSAPTSSTGRSPSCGARWTSPSRCRPCCSRASPRCPTTRLPRR